jgi:hypothetical protein
VNFVPPWNQDRLTQLKDMLEELAQESCGESPKRVLAVLTRNNNGAVSCLNLLMMAGLADHLSAVWSMQKNIDGREVPSGVFRGRDGAWHVFTPPLQDLPDHKADALFGIARDPQAWFPQGCPELAGLKPEEIVLVDDARTNFQSFVPGGPEVIRCCKVAHYDTEYLDMGWIKDMGGIGSRDEKDFRGLIEFVKEPWKFHVHSEPVRFQLPHEAGDEHHMLELAPGQGLLPPVVDAGGNEDRDRWQASRQQPPMMTGCREAAGERSLSSAWPPAAASPAVIAG